MRILHYTFGLPPNSIGGLPAYVNDISKTQMSFGHDVFILMPNYSIIPTKNFFSKGRYWYINNPVPVSSVFGMTNPSSFMKSYDCQIIRDFLMKINPQIIHIHSFMGLPIEFLKVANDMNIKTIFTTHDYYGICLKCNFINNKNSFCSEVDTKKCTLCNKQNGLSTFKCFLNSHKYFKLAKKNIFVKKFIEYFKKSRKISNPDDNYKINQDEINAYSQLLNYYKKEHSYIDYYHFNSSVSENMYKKHLNIPNSSVIPITLSSINKHKFKCASIEKIRFGFIGRKEAYKGFYVFLEAINELKKEGYDFECYLYGDDYSEFESNFVFNNGYYKKDDEEKVFRNMDVLVLPSLCMETFGFVVLEALSYGVPVLISENVGAKDLIPVEFNNFIFSTNDIKNKLKEILENPQVINEFQNNIPNFNINYSIQEHVKLLLNLYENILDATKGKS